MGAVGVERFTVREEQKGKIPENAVFSGVFLACLTRFERATYRVGVCHSIQLSYRHIFNFMHYVRTMGLQCRSLSLYPAELQAQDFQPTLIIT